MLSNCTHIESSVIELENSVIELKICFLILESQNSIRALSNSFNKLN